MKRYPVLFSIIVLFVISLSFFVAAENTEPESVSEESSSLAMETSTEFTTLAMETSTESFSELSSDNSSGFSDNQEAILNRLDLLYTLGLFVVAVLAALLVVFILWHVLEVFI